MNAGLPGTGIGGIFYLLSALWMPFHELYKTLKNKSQPQRMRLIVVQSGMALGIIAGIWLAGWLLGELMMMHAKLAFKPGAAAKAISNVPNAIKVTMVFLTIGLLTMVVTGVHILKLVIRYRKPSRASNIRVNSTTAFASQDSLDKIPHAHSREAMIKKADVVC
jgi:fucose permease